MNFPHLKKAKQTYSQHLLDSLYFSFQSFKASIIFLIHGIYPELYEFEGGFIIKHLNKIIEYKKLKMSC